MNQTHRHRTLERMVEDQVLRWEIPPVSERRLERSPVVAISRQEGTHGETAARVVAHDLGMDFYDQEIVHLMAEESHLRDRVIRSLDERARGFVEDLCTHLVSQYGITSDEYFDLLIRTIGAIDWHGNAVIVGRGAGYVVRRPENLVVRFVAPLPDRIEILSRERGLSPKLARERILEEDRKRRAFVHRYFRTTPEEEPFDLIVDNRYVGLDESIEVLKAAVLSRIVNERPASPGAA